MDFLLDFLESTSPGALRLGCDFGAFLKVGSAPGLDSFWLLDQRIWRYLMKLDDQEEIIVYYVC